MADIQIEYEPNSLPIRQNGRRSIGAWSCSTCRLLASADSSSLTEMLLDPKFPGSESLRLQDRPFGCLRQRRIATTACRRRPKQPATTGAGQNKRVDRVRRTAGCVRDRKPLAEGGSARRRTKSSAITVIRPSRGAGPSECVPPNCRGRLAKTALGHARLKPSKAKSSAINEIERHYGDPAITWRWIPVANAPSRATPPVYSLVLSRPRRSEGRRDIWRVTA